MVYTRLSLIASLALCACSVLAASQASQDVTACMRLVGERVAEYHRRLQSVMCVERSTVQPIQSNLSPDGFSRTVESDLRVEFDADGDAPPTATVVREVRRINGRAPRERDKTDRTGCTDPNPLSPEPLAFLLPEHRDEYRFTALHDVTERNRAAFAIDFSSVKSKGHPELIADEYGHDDCFDWKGPVAITGRVWVDAGTLDVLRLERRVASPTDVRVSLPLQRRYQFTPWLTLDRDDLTLHYKEVTFT